MPPVRFTSFDDAPLTLTLDEVAAIQRRAPSTIRRELQAGTFTPAPIGKRPYRWRKSDVEAHYYEQLDARRGRRTRRAKSGPA